MTATSHSDAVISELAMRVHGPLGQKATTPFGVMLDVVLGKYVVGQVVAAAGLDNCSPKLHALVVAVGTRSDMPGVWYLVQGIDDSQAFALIEETGLTPLWERPVRARGPLVDIRRMANDRASYRN